PPSRSTSPCWSAPACSPSAAVAGSSWPAATSRPCARSPRCSGSSRTSGAAASIASTHCWRRTDMPVTDVTKDIDTRTITITAEFAAPVERVWAVYADPRQLEKVWGPPGYPATFVEHELTVGSRSTYYMTAPDGQRFGGWWQITGVEAPHRFTF